MEKPRVYKRNRMSARHERLRELLVEARLVRELTQGQVAAALGRPQSFVSKYEHGDRHLDVIDLLALCAVLGCDAVAVVSELQAMAD